MNFLDYRALSEFRNEYVERWLRKEITTETLEHILELNGCSRFGICKKK